MCGCARNIGTRYDIEIEKKAVKAKVQVGLSPEEEIVQDSLKAAMDAANALGNEKLYQKNPVTT